MPSPRRRRNRGPAAAARPPQAVAGQPVALVATEEVWLRIDDGAGGPALFQGTMVPGQRFDVPPTAQTPTMRTGRPQVLRIQIGGRDIGPIEPAERTVSNVSLKAEDLVARQQGAAPAPAPPPAAPTPTPATPQ